MKKKGSKPPNRLHIEKLRNQREKDKLVTAINENISTLPTGTSEEQWGALKNAVYSAASEVLGKPTRKHADWFDELNEGIMELVDKKNSLFQRMLAGGFTKATKNKRKGVKYELQKKLRQMENDWWADRTAEIHILADQNNSKAFFASLREVYGPQGAHLDPVKSIGGNVLHTEKHKIMERTL